MKGKVGPIVILWLGAETDHCINVLTSEHLAADGEIVHPVSHPADVATMRIHQAIAVRDRERLQ